MSDNKGMFACVYRNARLGNCTNGPTADHSQVLLVGKDVPAIFEGDGYPKFKLIKSRFGHVIAVPSDSREDGIGTMFGGNYIDTSDSRFDEICRRLDPQHQGPVAVYDRDETNPFDTSLYVACNVAISTIDCSYTKLFAVKLERGLHPETAFDMIAYTFITHVLARDGDVFSGESEDGPVCLRCCKWSTMTSEQFSFMAGLDIELREFRLQQYIDLAGARGDLDSVVISATDGTRNGFWNHKTSQWGSLDLASRYSRNASRCFADGLQSGVVRGPSMSEWAAAKAVFCDVAQIRLEPLHVLD